MAEAPVDRAGSIRPRDTRAESLDAGYDSIGIDAPGQTRADPSSRSTTQNAPASPEDTVARPIARIPGPALSRASCSIPRGGFVTTEPGADEAEHASIRRAGEREEDHRCGSRRSVREADHDIPCGESEDARATALSVEADIHIRSGAETVDPVPGDRRQEDALEPHGVRADSETCRDPFVPPRDPPRSGIEGGRDRGADPGPRSRVRVDQERSRQRSQK